MKASEFDKFAEEYAETHARNIKASGESPEYFAAYKVDDLKRLLGTAGLEGMRLRILDFGGGTGTSVPYFRDRFPESSVTCLDVSLRSLQVGRRRFTDAAFVAFDGQRLPVADSSMDVAFAACVFHHIDHERHHDLFLEIRRVLKPGAPLMIYEHNPFNPLTRRAVDTCPFDANAVLVRPGQLCNDLVACGFRTPKVHYRVFFPRMLAALRVLEWQLRWLPLGAQYYAVALK